MIKPAYIVLPFVFALPSVAEETRELSAHEHGVGVLNIAVDGENVAMELLAPGADIVGFEYAATSAEDLASIEDAIARLNTPLSLFEIPEAAGCSVVSVAAELETEGGHDDHADGEHAHQDHDKHAEEGHDHDDHAEEGHDHDNHEGEGGHAEFKAAYMLTCNDTGSITQIGFAYFEAFPNALEVEVQIVTPSGASSYEVERNEPVLELDGLF